MKLRSLAPALAACVSLAVLPGCIPWWLFEVDDPPPMTVDPEETETFLPPSVDDVSIADWPPVGPSSVITATVSAEEGLDRVTFEFAKTVSRDLAGREATVEVTGEELGEGLGTMHVVVRDLQGGWADREVTGLLVDLSPPKGQLVKSVVRRGESVDIQAWVGDAWVLGGFELTFGGVTRTREFEPGYPSALGEAWDVSLVTFPSVDFPESSGKATLRAWDAAGNQVVTEVDLTLDGTPPVAQISSPAPGSVVSGPVTIEVAGSDETGGAVEIDVFVAGTPVATLPGPTAMVTVDVSELAKGAAQIEAVARDSAGNTSEVAVIDVVIE